MRLLERTLREVLIAPRQVSTDALGARLEGFSQEKRRVRASVIPSTEGLRAHESGLLRPQTMCLLLAADAQVNVGDGVCIDGEAPEWRCAQVERWSAHLAVRIERIEG